MELAAIIFFICLSLLCMVKIYKFLAPIFGWEIPDCIVKDSEEKPPEDQEAVYDLNGKLVGYYKKEDPQDVA